MTWAKFDDRYPLHRKVRPLSDAAFRLHVSAVCYCAENLTDGFIAAEFLNAVSDVKRPKTAVAELVTRDLFEVVPGGWKVHDYLDYNPDKEFVLETREKRAEAGARGGKASAASKQVAKQSAQQLANQSAKQTASNMSSKTQANLNPVPVPVGYVSSGVGTEVETARAKSPPQQRTGEQPGEPPPEDGDDDGLPRIDELSGAAARVVDAYVEGARNTSKPTPSKRLQSQVRTSARRLLNVDGYSADELCRAARLMAAKGWTDLDKELQMTPRPAVGNGAEHPPGWEFRPTPAWEPTP